MTLVGSAERGLKKAPKLRMPPGKTKLLPRRRRLSRRRSYRAHILWGMIF
uniref:Uncharacterized protein n=1 Tax=Arundo donax TaxID=35708 RepID=A0A0A9ALT4_ARUDO